MTVRDEELFGGGRLPWRIPWHVMDVSRNGRSARGCDDCAESRGNRWRIHQRRQEATRMDEFPRMDERRLAQVVKLVLVCLTAIPALDSCYPRR